MCPAANACVGRVVVSTGLRLGWSDSACASPAYCCQLSWCCLDVLAAVEVFASIVAHESLQVDDDFHPPKKGDPDIVVTDLDHIVQRLAAAGNRFEFLEPE